MTSPRVTDMQLQLRDAPTITLGAGPRQERLAQAIDEFYAEIDAGQTIDRERLLEKYADVADELDDCLRNLDFIQNIAPQLSTDTSAQRADVASTIAQRTQLGDYQIIREIGRGGMGVVYEAEQMSLGRRVALKVLPFAAMLDKQQLARFKNEARAAATLKHPNIVSVYSVGCERSVHFFAMELVEGQSLAQVIEQLRRSHLPRPLGEGRGAGQVGAASRAALPDNTDLSDSSPARTSASSVEPLAGPTADTAPIAHLSTLPDFSSKEYYRSVAQLGIQAAEALDHAHQNGILHRDIKPANLLVDDTGKLWITDFGLARMEADTGMTITGDILGTLRYMSPEQALANRVIVDHRSDIYSLGVTLYELLTLQPTFTGDDRQELLRQIAFEEPRKPRQFNARIPRDLETIILKAIEKNPADRYLTAKELSDELRRYLEDQPIKAKPPSLLAATRKWSRRHRRLLGATVSTIVISGLVLAGSIGWVVRDRAARQSVTEAAATANLEEATRLVEQQRWSEALGAARRAEDILVTGSGTDASKTRALGLRNDIEMVLRLQDIQFNALGKAEKLIEKSWRVYDPETDRYYAKAFRNYSIDVEMLSPQTAAERIAPSRIMLELVYGIDSWAEWLRNFKPDGDWERLVKIARLADPDPWRNRFRDAQQKKGNERIAAAKELASSIDPHNAHPQTINRSACLLIDSRLYNRAVESLLIARRRFPNEFWINYWLGFSYASTRDWNQALRYYTVAQSLQPESPVANSELSHALYELGLFDDAIASYRVAMRLHPDDTIVQLNLARMLNFTGMSDEAIPVYRTLIQHIPDDAAKHVELGNALANVGLLDEAIANFREAIRLKPDYNAAYRDLVATLVRTSKPEDAFEELKSIQSKFGASHANTLAATNGLVTELARGGKKLTEARRLAEEAVAAARRDLGPDHGQTLKAMKSLVRVFMWNGESLTETDAEYGQKLCEETLDLALRTLGPDADDTVRTANDLGRILQVRGQFEQAYQLYEKTHADNWRIYGANHDRNFSLMRDAASALIDLGRIDEAATKLEAAIKGVRHLFSDRHFATLEWTLLFAITKSKLGKYDEARQLYEQVLETSRKHYKTGHWIGHQSRRAMAWFLATADSDQHRDGRRAVELAMEACELTKYSHALTIDTLAAAYAETGDFEAAVTWSTKALELVKNPVMRTKYSMHLETFQAAKPWRDYKTTPETTIENTSGR